MSDISHLLSAAQDGDRHAAAQLLPLVYEELRGLAAAQMANERPGQTLDPTALVHEAYLRLIHPPSPPVATGGSMAPDFANTRHFFAAAAEAMRRILIENARRKSRTKHGGGRRRVVLNDAAAPRSNEDLLALDEALTGLSAEDALAGRVVELRNFAGLGHEQIAEVLGITVYQARQKWTYARAWLHEALGDES